MKKVIAIFCGYYLPHLGGIERYIANLSKELIKNNYRVIIVSSNYNNSKTIEKKDNLIEMRLPIYNLFKNRYPIIKHHNKDYKKVMKELDKYKIDRIIVNTRFHLTSLIGAKYGKRKNIPVYLIEHGSNHLSINNKILDKFGELYEHILTKIIEKYVDYNYGVSYAACDWQKHFHIKSDGVWYNSINRFDKNITIKKSVKKIKIIYAGRILKQKGVEELILAFNKLKNKYKNIELIIAGDGDYLSYLKNTYKQEGINYLGSVSFEKLIKLYAESNIFVYASNYPEGLPTSILEAGLMKCACIVSPNGGTRHFINKNNGIIVTNQNELEKALEKCIANKEYREEIGEELSKTIINNFTWEKTTKKILKDMDV